MPAAVAQRLLDMGITYYEGYGLTETMGATHLNPPEHPKKQCLGIPIFDVDSRVVDPVALDGKFGLVASPDGRERSIRIQQDATLSIARLKAGGTASIQIGAGRKAWVQVSRGSAETGGTVLSAGDGAAVREETQLGFRASDDAEILVFDLP